MAWPCRMYEHKGMQSSPLSVLTQKAGRCPEDIIDVYKSIVRSIIEYATEVWYISLSDDIERTQHGTVKITLPDSQGCNTQDYTIQGSISRLCVPEIV